MRLHILTTFTVGTLCLLSYTPPAAAQSALERLERLLGGAPEAAPNPGEAGQPTPAPLPPPPSANGGSGGASESGYLGLLADDENEQGFGVRVVKVHANSPAQRAGALPLDLITSINGRRMTSINDMGVELSRLRAGDEVVMEINRNGERRKLVAVLAPRPAGEGPAAREPISEPQDVEIPPTIEFGDPAEVRNAPPAAGRASLGVNVSPVTPDLRQQLRLPVQQGALIREIQPGGPADRYGLPIGGVIVAFDGQRVDNPDDLVQMIAASAVGQQVEITYYAGNRLARRQLRLGPPAAVAPQRGDDPLVLGPNGGDANRTRRPILGAVERALGAFGNGNLEENLGGLNLPIPPAAGETQADSLRQEVLRLRNQVTNLERRLAELEQQLNNQPKSP